MTENIHKLTEVFKALSDPTRLRLVKILSDHGGVLCVNALTKRLDVTQSAVSQHLRVLRQADLVIAERQGARIHYSINKKRLAQHHSLVQSVLGEDFL